MNISRKKVTTAVSLIIAGAGSIAAQNVLANGLEEVVVTAQKRSQSVQDIPVAVTGISGDDIEQLGFTSPNDVSAQVPNMQVSGPYGKAQPIFSIRGISMADYNSNQASPVGVYIDESYMPATYTHGLNFFDVERIEVLRGPQGTLYGKNTTGGAVNLITVTPELDGELEGYVSLGYGNYDATVVNGAVEAPLIDGKLAARIAFSTEKDDGYYENRLGGPDLAQTDFKAVRIALNWQPTEELNAVFKYTSGESSPRNNPARNEGRIAVPGLGNVDLTGYQRPDNFDFHEGEFNQTGSFRTESDQATLRLTYDAEGYSIVSVSSWNDAEFLNEAEIDGHGGPNNLDIDYAGASESISQDLRFVSDFEGSFNFIAGIYYGKEENEMHNIFRTYNADFNLLLAGGDPLGPLLADFGGADVRFESTKESHAIYGQARWELSERLGLDVGLRYTEDESSFDYFNVSRTDHEGNPIGTWAPGNILQINAPFIPAGTVSPTDPGFFLDAPYTLDSIRPFSVTEREWTGKISLDYAISDELMTYVSYSRGFRAGSLNGGTNYAELPQEENYAAPEFVDAYELGFKGDFFDNLLRVNGALFFYDYTDQQFVNVVGLSIIVENAGKSEVFGAEFEVWAQPTDNLVIKTSLGWLETEYTELELGDTNGNPVDLSGNELISAPDLNISLAIDYDIPLSWGTLRAHADANYQDDQWFSAFNDLSSYGEIKQDDYWLYNARLSAVFGTEENCSVSAWVKNLTDEEYDSYAINLQAGFGYDYFLAGAPRTYGVEFTYQF